MMNFANGSYVKKSFLIRLILCIRTTYIFQWYWKSETYLLRLYLHLLLSLKFITTLKSIRIKCSVVVKNRFHDEQMINLLGVENKSDSIIDFLYRGELFSMTISGIKLFFKKAISIIGFCDKIAWRGFNPLVSSKSTLQRI